MNSLNLNRKLGRKPRKFDMRIPRARLILKRGLDLPSIPDSRDYSVGLPDDLGQYLNDSLGDCTCAAYYHARQIWTAVAGDFMITEAAVEALLLYEAACGYKPGDPTTDQGGVEQDVLAYLLNTGAPLANGAVDKILGYVEVDQNNFEDLRRVIYDCGVAYIGIQVPQSVMDNADNSSMAWDTGGNNEIVGGHAVILVGYKGDDFICISWGKRYRITGNFMRAYLEEAYGIIDQSWIESTGKTPLGMSIDELQYAMRGLKYASID